MAKSKNDSSYWSELLSLGLYKPKQGRLVRQLSGLAVALVVFLAAWTLSQGPLSENGDAVRIGVPVAVSVVGAWFAFRLVHYSKFADFLISVEAEMDKVSWASKQELLRATIVVLVTMFFLGFVLLGFDLFWRWLFRLTGWLQF